MCQYKLDDAVRMVTVAVMQAGVHAGMHVSMHVSTPALSQSMLPQCCRPYQSALLDRNVYRHAYRHVRRYVDGDVNRHTGRDESGPTTGAVIGHAGWAY